MTQRSLLIQRWLTFLILAFGSLNALGQDARIGIGVRTDGFYAYSWKGQDLRVKNRNCDSITSPDVFFPGSTLFFFYNDSTIVEDWDSNFKTATDSPLSAAYFQKNQSVLGSNLRAKDGRNSGHFGVYHRHGETLIAKMRFFEYSWDKARAYYHFLVKSLDTLLLTGFDCKSCVYCIMPDVKVPVIKFDPSVLLTFLFFSGEAG